MALITISRGSLSGGRAVAECLADELGYPCLAREILRRAARNLGASEDVLQAKFEATPGLWARRSRDREQYVLAVQTALAEACLDGNLVYHGLAGQFLLRDLPGVLRVRLIAPMEFRVRMLMDSRHRISEKAAADFIHNVDQDRKRWVKLSYGVDVADPSLYDLTVNLRSLSLDTACTVISEAASQPTYEATEDLKARIAVYASTCRRRLDEMLGRA